MNFEEFLAEYRRSGGIAENVRLSHGRFGRGLFPIDPQQPATVFTPQELTVPIDAVEIRNDKMLVKAGAVPEPAATLFALYQEQLGWSAGGREEAWRRQAQWHELPPEVVTAIESMGALDYPGRRFLAPNDETCMFDYFQTRFFGLRGGLRIVPVVDLVNYSGEAGSYLTEGGFGVTGIFADEMLVRYSFADAFALQLNYGFTALTNFAYSLGITVNLPGGTELTIGRSVEGGESHGGVILPPIERQANSIRLGHLKLGNLAAPDLPRSIFRAAISSFAAPAQADELFDLIARFNRTRFIDLLRTLRKCDGPLVRDLETASLNQLEAMSACTGARSL